MPEEDVDVADEEKQILKHEKFLKALPPDVRKYYSKKPTKTKGKRERSEYSITPLKKLVTVYLIYGKDCPNCKALMESLTFRALIRYFWARGIRFRTVMKDEAFLFGLDKFVFPDAYPNIYSQNPNDNLSFYPFYTPLIVIEKDGAMTVIDYDPKLAEENPYHLFYRIQMEIEGEIVVPLMSMALRLRRASKVVKPEELKLALEDMEMPKPHAGGGVIVKFKEKDKSSQEIKPCSEQPRC